jgi:hypothetical protein
MLFLVAVDQMSPRPDKSEDKRVCEKLDVAAELGLSQISLVNRVYRAGS